MNVNIDGPYVSVPYNNFRILFSELEILATKEIPYNEEVMALLKDPEVKERHIHIRARYSFYPPMFEYRVVIMLMIMKK